MSVDRSRSLNLLQGSMTGTQQEEGTPPKRKKTC